MSVRVPSSARTIGDLLADAAGSAGDQPAYSWEGGSLTWQETRELVLDVAAGFGALGVVPGDAVVLMATNRIEHVVGDLGAVHAGAVTTTAYSTLAPEQVRHVAADSGAVLAVLEGPDALARWRPVLADLPLLRTVVLLDHVDSGDLGDLGDRTVLRWDELVTTGRKRRSEQPEAAEALWRKASGEDALCVIYTSGTTGHPKGVVLTHDNALAQVRALTAHSPLPDHVESVSYLPLAHIAERVLSLYLPAAIRAHVHLLPDPAQLLATLQRVRPTSVFGVPRVWEKIRAGVLATVEAGTDPERRRLAQACLATAREAALVRAQGRSPGLVLAARLALADRLVLSKVRAVLGLDRVAFASVGAAPVPLDVELFFGGLGVPLFGVYGMTETTGAAVAHRAGRLRPGTVGEAMPGVELRLADDGEVLLRSALNTPGYRGLPEATAELVDEAGWLHTGDIGVLHPDGLLSITDRKKELIITAGGKNISPAVVEALLKESPLVGQALAYGDRRPYVVGLVVLDTEAAPAWAAARGIDDTSLSALAVEPLVLAEVARAVEAANARLARVEQVRRWTLLATEWTPATDELTPTLKLKRRVVHERYATEIEALYA